MKKASPSITCQIPKQLNSSFFPNTNLVEYPTEWIRIKWGPSVLPIYAQKLKLHNQSHIGGEGFAIDLASAISVYLKCFGTQLKTVYLQGPCFSRPCISRPCCSFIPLTLFTYSMIQMKMRPCLLCSAHQQSNLSWWGVNISFIALHCADGPWPSRRTLGMTKKVCNAWSLLWMLCRAIGVGP